MRQIVLPVLIALLSACGSNSPAQPAAAGQALYAKYCIGCHGRDLRGGTASNLIAENLKHGSSREAIYKSIADGIPDLGMPAYKATLSQTQLSQLTDFIVAKREGKDTAAATAAQSVPEPKKREVIETLDYQVNVDVWVDGLDTPWSIDWLDASRAVVTEKKGTVRLITNGQLDPKPIAGTPKVDARGQGGMLDVAPDPEYSKNGWIYLSYSHLLDNGNAMTRVVRGKITDGAWTDQQVVWEAPPETYQSTRHHYGCRIVFDKEGRLYFAVGERGHQDLAQRLDRPNGKVYRINRDGTVPQDNPFIGRQGALPAIYSYGHRNPQGLDFHPVTGELWDAEHGPRGGDELNIVKPGANYGWPVITYGINYSGSVITRERVRPGLEQPIYFWRPSTGLCAIEFYEGSEFPLWQNHLLVAALARRDLRLLTVEEGRVLHEEVILKDRARVRDVNNGPDGAIYVVLNDPGQILRLTSAGEALQ